jgi:hypothetical protein
MPMATAWRIKTTIVPIHSKVIRLMAGAALLHRGTQMVTVLRTEMTNVKTPQKGRTSMLMGAQIHSAVPACQTPMKTVSAMLRMNVRKLRLVVQ